MSLYDIDYVFSPEEISELLGYYTLLKSDKIETVDNLGKIIFVEIKKEIPLLNKLKLPNYQPAKHYFVGYQKDSYAIPHMDKDGKGITRLTVLRIENLKGGYPVYMEAVSNHGYNAWIPVIYDREFVGETRTTRWSSFHGVSKIFEGERIVLVSWYGENK